MYCSGCGQTLVPGQGICPQCGRPAQAPVPQVPGLQFQLENYAGKLRALSVVWFIYAAFALLTGIAGMAFANAFMSGHFGPWMHGPWSRGPMPPMFFMPALLHFAWLFLIVRAGLAFAAAWGLMERAPWGASSPSSPPSSACSAFPSAPPSASGPWSCSWATATPRSMTSSPDRGTGPDFAFCLVLQSTHEFS